jgi:hypothetical protein
MRAITRDDFADLVKTANIKPRVRRDMRFVPEDITDWEDRDFLAVMNRSKSEGVLVAPFDTYYIAPFQLQKRKPNSVGRTEAIICDFCVTWQRGSNSAIISFTREKSTVSFLCCGDLLCSLHVRNKTPAAKISRTQLRENNTVQQRVERLRTKLEVILKS